MGAEAHDVLQQDLVVVVVLDERFPVELQPYAAELAVRPVEHERERGRVLLEAPSRLAQ